jgi:hypothetical protein
MGVTDDVPGVDLLGASQAIWIDERSGRVVEMLPNGSNARAEAFSSRKHSPDGSYSRPAHTLGRQLQFSFVSKSARRSWLPPCGLPRLAARRGAP